MSAGARLYRHDYEQVARALRGARRALSVDLRDARDKSTATLIMDNLTMELAGYFAGTNPLFSVGRFADASGMPPSAMRQDAQAVADGEVLSAGCSHGR